MATNPQAYPFAQIALAIQTRLVSAGVVASGYAYIGLGNKPPGYPTEKWLRIIPGGISNQDMGGGRWDMNCERNVAVEIYTRFEVDVAGDSTAELTNADTVSSPLGHLYFEEQVIEYLHLWTPLSTEIPQKTMTRRPLKLTGSGPPAKDSGQRVSSDGRFVTSTLNFSCEYIPPLSLQVPSGNPPTV